MEIKNEWARENLINNSKPLETICLRLIIGNE